MSDEPIRFYFTVAPLQSAFQRSHDGGARLIIDIPQMNMDALIAYERGEMPNVDELWKGMPEFEQEDQSGIRCIVHFEHEADKAAFEQLIGQQFHAFLQNKIATQMLGGGNTAEFYAKEGTLPKSQMLARVHPDVARVVHRFGRIHYHVDYRRFKTNTPKLKPGVVIPDEPNNYGMVLTQRNPMNGE